MRIHASIEAIVKTKTGVIVDVIKQPKPSLNAELSMPVASAVKGRPAGHVMTDVADCVV